MGVQQYCSEMDKFASVGSMIYPHFSAIANKYDDLASSRPWYVRIVLIHLAMSCVSRKLCRTSVGGDLDLIRKI